MELAESQHAAYVRALRSSGLQINFVKADDERIDCVFIEDTAIVWDGQALITRMNPHREGEQPAVEAFLGKTHRIARLQVSERLEGGDVLHTDQVTYVGESSRTNQAGIAALRKFLAPLGRPVVPVPVRRCLHLKTAATYLGDRTMMVAPKLLDAFHFDVEEVIETEPGEESAANCLRIGSHLLIPAGTHRTEKKLRVFSQKKGLEIVPLECSEFQKGGGSLTCLSLLW